MLYPKPCYNDQCYKEAVVYMDIKFCKRVAKFEMVDSKGPPGGMTKSAQSTNKAQYLRNHSEPHHLTVYNVLPYDKRIH